MTAPRCALVLLLAVQGCLLEDGRTITGDGGPDAFGGAGGFGGSGGSTNVDSGVGGSGGSSGGTGGATTGTGGGGTGGATTGTGGAGTGGNAGSAGASGAGTGGTGGKGGAGGAAGAGGKGGASGTGGSTVIDSGVDARVVDASDSGSFDSGAPDRAGGDACTSPPTLDTDGDGTPDCTDGCPRDARKTQPGACGCNVAEPAGADAGGLACLRGALVHRYSFNDAGGTDAGADPVISDSIGTAHGSLRGGANATLSNGTVSLSGDKGAGYTSEGYVHLPADVLSGLTNATLEAWVTWRGAAGGTGANWQRLFDFGDQQASGASQNGRTYLFVTPSSGSNTLRMTWSSNGSANETFIDQPALPTGMLKHVAIVLDDAAGTASLCIDGTCSGSATIAGALRGITPVNNWLGRSNYSVDPELNGIIHEFRIYNAALNAALLRASFMAGPDASL